MCATHAHMQCGLHMTRFFASLCAEIQSELNPSVESIDGTIDGLVPTVRSRVHLQIKAHCWGSRSTAHTPPPTHPHSHGFRTCNAACAAAFCKHDDESGLRARLTRGVGARRRPALRSLPRGCIGAPHNDASARSNGAESSCQQCCRRHHGG